MRKWKVEVEKKKGNVPPSLEWRMENVFKKKKSEPE